MAGGWSGKEMSNAKFAQWIEAILLESGFEAVEPFSGHSAKRTLLSWTAKYGLSMHTQAILGHHSLSKERTPLVHARDAQAAPIREMEEVVLQVRQGTFRPDLTRSGQVVSSHSKACDDAELEWYRNNDVSAPVPVHLPQGNIPQGDPEDQHDFPPEPPGLGNLRLASEPDADLEDFEYEPEPPESPSREEGSGAPEQGEDSSSSSSSSSSPEDSDAHDQELREGCSDPSTMEQAIVEGRSIFQHSRTKTLHFLPAGTSSETFICGRVKSADHKPFRTKICSEKWFCKQCLAGRPIRDRGSLLRALEIAMAKK